VEPIVAVWVRAPVASFDTEPAQGPGQLEGPPDHPAGVESPGGLQEESQPPLPQNIRVAGPAVIGPLPRLPLGIGTSPSGWSRPHSVTRSPLSVHFQSTFSPHVGPHSVHVGVHVRGSTWTPWRSTSKGVTKGMVERAGGPLCLPRGETVLRAVLAGVAAGMAGGRDNIQ
jgi:hypothetical protein